MRRAEQLRATALHVQGAPILLEGDAEVLLAALRAGAGTFGIPETDHASTDQPARVVVLAIHRDSRRSSLVKATKLLRRLDDEVAPDAVRIVVVQSVRSRLVPPRLLRLIASEILFQVAIALPGVQAAQMTRTLRQRWGLTTLDAAGFRVLRFG